MTLTEELGQLADKVLAKHKKRMRFREITPLFEMDMADLIASYRALAEQQAARVERLRELVSFMRDEAKSRMDSAPKCVASADEEIADVIYASVRAIESIIKDADQPAEKPPQET